MNVEMDKIGRIRGMEVYCRSRSEEGVLRRGFKTDVSSIVAFVADNVSVFLPVPLATSINALAIETSLAPRANPSARNPILFP